MEESKSPADRLLDLVVFGPAGLALTATEEFPKLVDKGRHHLEGQIRTARLVGQVAFQMGRRQLDQLVSQRQSKPPPPPRPATPEPSASSSTVTAPAPESGAPATAGGRLGRRGAVGQRQRNGRFVGHSRLRQPVGLPGRPAPGRTVAGRAHRGPGP